MRSAWCVVVAGSLLASACGRCGAPTSNLGPSRPDAPDARDDAVAALPQDAGGDAHQDAGTAARCGPTLLQPETCVSANAEFNLESDAIRAWFAVRGVTSEGYTFAHCRELVFGPGEERVLLCIDMQPLAIDKHLGMAGPVEYRYDLEVVTTRSKERVELLRLPFALGMSSSDYSAYSELLFSARYAVDPVGGTIDLEASPRECASALTMLRPYWSNQSSELRANAGIPPRLKAELVQANELERISDTQRIEATCRAAGHYVRSHEGHLVKAAK